ncbi:MAG: hypothetical protein COU28_03490 [Candidatus Magasanikbacteria bacterium CG10_big_fil_rev_8_21_14_0_10_36_16]|uniref:Uncharacterized protein n=1 Tax=Candidatus Magasanikbacteria bacterium CG10_big_fil_rev_8_21_14_0_10_36_16 TaxID=1974645 RepID=A0A2H0TXZ0_9BACT|nr:MAG: hypothetical protein COU28_03490 [Candidatus Magasanikbacteria bacterium CG10_big_fil_rev_8_21_14_0_10_36_16]
MSKKILYITIFILVLILGFVFYWYSYRLEQIRKECYKEAYNKPAFRFVSNEDLYKQCLLSKGIK